MIQRIAEAYQINYEMQKIRKNIKLYLNWYWNMKKENSITQNNTNKVR